MEKFMPFTVDSLALDDPRLASPPASRSRHSAQSPHDPTQPNRNETERLRRDAWLKPLKRGVLSVFAGLCAFMFSLGLATNADATLLSRAGGLAVYDTDLDITWLSDFGLFLPAQGFASTTGPLFRAFQYVDALNLLEVAGVSNWRVPTGDPTCPQGCASSEMGHLFYDELGGTLNQAILTSGDPDLALFSNFELPDEGQGFWTSTLASATQNHVYSFEAGVQVSSPFSGNRRFAAVASGDVAPIPEPGTAVLMGFGLAGLSAFRRRRRN